MRRVGPAVVAALVALLGACASGARTDFGLAEREAAFPVGFPSVRFSVEDRVAAEVLEAALSKGVPRGPDGHFDLIALSGGGANGAYTAGLITAWTERGERPDFEVVTGVSTGALAAPFVFLGEEYDDELREAYTGGRAAHLLRSRGIGAFVGSGVFSGEPLRELVEAYIDAPLVERVAEAHRGGRVLLVATTDLDAERGVIWNMGAIADRGGPEALALFRDVLTASASIPGALPPVMIRSQSMPDGVATPEEFEEMHVDGGVMNPFVALPQMMWTWSDEAHALEGGRIWVIVNGKAEPVFDVTVDSPLTVARRALDAALKANLRANLIANAAFAQRAGLEYRVSAIPTSFRGADSLDFEPEAMNSVYELGRTRMLAGEAWTNVWAPEQERAPAP